MTAPKYPPPTPGVVRVTQSSLESYLRCGLRWEKEQGARHRFATVRMLIGTATSAGAEEDNRTKIARGTPATLTAIVDSAVAGYEEEAQGADVPEPKIEIARGKDDAAAAARAFGEQISPQLPSVIMAEKPLVVTIRGFELAGTPDVVTTDGIGDLKTGQPWNQERADRSRQLTGYTVLHRIHLGIYPRKVWIDSLAKRPRGWVAERMWSRRTATDIEAFISTAEIAARAMAAGVALPAPEGAWWCSSKWCPHWGTCPAVGNGK